MLLRDDPQITAFDKHRWVISTNVGHNLLVNNAAAQLFVMLRDVASLEQAREQFNHNFQSALTTQAFSALVLRHFGGYGILAQDQSDKKTVTTDEYIKLKVELFSSDAAAFFASPLRIFYAPRFFWLCFVSIFLFLLSVHLSISAKASPQGPDYWVTALLIYLSIFVHEFGHIAACSRFRIKHGGIGFGFYLYMFPVLYADVTNVWQANQQQRIITNLGGIFSQLLYASVLASTYLVIGYYPLLFAAMATAVVALWQFNPFVRHDGYWLLSDITNTPNLLSKASHVTKNALSRHGFERVVRSRGKVLLNKKILLLLYGVANASLLLGFAGYTILRYGDQLVQFPFLVFSIFGKLLVGNLLLADVRQINMVVFAFYVMVFRYLFTAIVQKYKSTQRAI